MCTRKPLIRFCCTPPTTAPTVTTVKIPVSLSSSALGVKWSWLKASQRSGKEQEGEKKSTTNLGLVLVKLRFKQIEEIWICSVTRKPTILREMKQERSKINVNVAKISTSSQMFKQDIHGPNLWISPEGRVISGRKTVVIPTSLSAWFSYAI